MSEEYRNPEEEASEAAETKGKKKKEKVKKTVGQEILSWIVTIVVAVVAALVIRSFIFEPVRVDGESMMDTLKDGDIMFVSKWDYDSVWLSMPWQSASQKEAAPRLAVGLGSPARFDVVVCRYPGRGDTNFVKRIIGMPGDVVAIEDGYVYVNGEKYDEPYINDAYRVAGGSNGQTYEATYVPAAGDTIQAKDGHLYINGEQRDDVGRLYPVSAGHQEETEAFYAAMESGEEYTVQQDLYLVMGDHRNNSNDSRSVGPITRDMIIGHVRFVFWPLSTIRGVE